MTELSPLFSQLRSTDRPGVTNGQASIAENFDNFLQLLTVQLQNQDPTEPLDTNQFTQQIVQMTEVEQSVSMNERLGALIEAQETSRIQSAVQFVGKHADAIGNVVPPGEDGAELFYSLPAPASSIRAAIIDPSIEDPLRRVVATLSPPSDEAGLHRLRWDGLNDAGEKPPADRPYVFEVVALAANDQQIQTRTGFSGQVDELRHVGGALTLSVAGLPVQLSEIVAARAPAAALPTPAGES